MLPGATKLRSPVGQDAQQAHILLFKKRQGLIVEQIGVHQGVFPVIELDKSHLVIGVAEGLLIDAPNGLR